MTGARQRDDASQRPGAMSTSHLAPVAVSAIVGGKTVFRVGRGCDGKQSSGKESRSIHDKTLAPPRQQSYRTVQSNRGPSPRRWTTTGHRAATAFGPAAAPWLAATDASARAC